jgi:hypothetical protein
LTKVGHFHRMSIDDFDTDDWRREYRQRQHKRARNLDLAVDLVATGQATVAETAHLAGASRQTIQARCSQDARFQVPSLQADGTPYLNIKGQPMTHADIPGVRRRHLDGLWATAVEKWTAAVEKHEADEAERERRWREEHGLD